MPYQALSTYPQRIVCLTPETTETLYLLGEQDRIVGISGFSVYPPEARTQKPKVSAYTTARFDRILALAPDLVLALSDLQADVARELIRAGIEVHVFNQRSVAGILRMIATVAAPVGARAAGDRLVADLAARLERTRAENAARSPRPRVYFEEWDEPMICGILWISELIDIAGGADCFSERANRSPRGASSKIPRKSSGVRRMSSSARGVARSFAPQRYVRAPGGATSRPWPAIGYTKSNPPTSCSRVRARSPAVSMRLYESCTPDRTALRGTRFPPVQPRAARTARTRPETEHVVRRTETRGGESNDDGPAGRLSKHSERV